jgi:predicted ATPase
MRTGFVGRKRELELLEDCLTSARAGHPRVVLCRGEPGIGKTRLAEEFSAMAEAYGVLAVWGAAAGSAGAPPYWPWLQVLRALSEDVDLGAIAREHRLTADLTGWHPTCSPARRAAATAAVPPKIDSDCSTRRPGCSVR